MVRESLIPSHQLWLALAIFMVLGGPPSLAQDVSRMNQIQLRERASAAVAEGDLIKARPFLIELVNLLGPRLTEEGLNPDEVYWLIAIAYNEEYSRTNDRSLLEAALPWFERLRNEYPASPKVADAIREEVDILRVVGKIDEAIALMERMLRGEFSFQVLGQARDRLIEEIARTYYLTGRLIQGLSYFEEIIRRNANPEAVALAAAAAFEGYFQVVEQKTAETHTAGPAISPEEAVTRALGLLPRLAQESEVRYRPRLNVAMLRASDTLVDRQKTNQANQVLALIKTTDQMIAFHEAQLAQARTNLARQTGISQNSLTAQQLQRQIIDLTATLEQLRTLPGLQNELTVRRARNYALAERRYEAFWTFFRLWTNNREHPEAEFYTYATFTSAVAIDNTEHTVTLGNFYLTNYPQGSNVPYVSVILADSLLAQGRESEFRATTERFISTYPQDPNVGGVIAKWAAFLLGKDEARRVLEQLATWESQHGGEVYGDFGLFFKGLANLQINELAISIGQFERLLNSYPTSSLREDASMRLGFAVYYNQQFTRATDLFETYLADFPSGAYRDQAHYLLGEMAKNRGELQIALDHFNEANRLASTAELRGAITLQIASIYRIQGRNQETVTLLERFIETTGKEWGATEAAFELALAYEALLQPTEGLRVYREMITAYAPRADDFPVDRLIDTYGEYYLRNRTMLQDTRNMIAQVRDDSIFRQKFFSDRGFLFEVFYNNKNIHQSLYNRLRFDARFNESLARDLTPILPLLTPYEEEWARFPQEPPEAFFHQLRARFIADGELLGEIRMLMGLFRSGRTIPPSRPYNDEVIDTVPPQVLLFIADSSRNADAALAEKAWTRLIERFPQHEASMSALIQLAEIQINKSQIDQALEYLNTARRYFPGSPLIPAVILRQGELLVQKGLYGDARNEYESLLRVAQWRGETHAEALLHIGQSYVLEGKLQEARAYFERTFLAYPHLPQMAGRAYLAEADALLRLGRRDDAVATLREATNELRSSAPPALFAEIQAKLASLGS